MLARTSVVDSHLYRNDLDRAMGVLDACSSYPQVYGSWCDMIEKANMVQILYGCPLINVP
jgi:hypothetical protein